MNNIDSQQVMYPSERKHTFARPAPVIGGIPLICFPIYEIENGKRPFLFLCFANIQKEKGKNRCFSLLIFMVIFWKLLFCAFSVINIA